MDNDRSIKRFRALAEEIRTSADGMAHTVNRETLLRIAADYDVLADRAEARAQRDQRRKDRHTG